MEDHPGQATVDELNDIYALHEIDRQTKFIAVAGFGELEQETVRIMNAGFRALDQNMRCLPVAIESLDRLAKMFDILKIRVLIANAELGVRIQPFAEFTEKDDAESGFLDLLLRQADGWHGYNTLRRATVKHLEPKLKEVFPQDSSLNRRPALVVGHGGLAKTAVSILQQKQSVVGLTGPDEKLTSQEATELSVRNVPFQSMYDTHHDIVVLADPNLQKGSGRTQMNPSFFSPDMLVIDFSSMGQLNPLGEEAISRRCHMVNGQDVWRDLLSTHFKAITGHELPESVG